MHPPHPPQAKSLKQLIICVLVQEAEKKQFF